MSFFSLSAEVGLKCSVTREHEQCIHWPLGAAKAPLKLFMHFNFSRFLHSLCCGDVSKGLLNLEI